MRPLALLSLFGLLGACSSIPDVTFADDAGTLEASSASDAGPDVARTEPYTCPGNPPPESVGVCCRSFFGERLCLNCTRSHCDRCIRAGCDGDEVCCGRSSGNQVDCRSPTACE